MYPCLLLSAPTHSHLNGCVRQSAVTALVGYSIHPIIILILANSQNSSPWWRHTAIDRALKLSLQIR